jgi:acyl carrier protein
MELPDKLRDFINEQRQPLPPVTDPDEPLRIDSLGLMRLVSFLETEIGYTVQDEELTLQNFESLRTISKMLEGKGEKMA